MCTQWGEAQPGPTMESAPCFHVLDPSVPLGSWARGWEAQIWELLSWVTLSPLPPPRADGRAGTQIWTQCPWVASVPVPGKSDSLRNVDRTAHHLFS